MTIERQNELIANATGWVKGILHPTWYNERLEETNRLYPPDFTGVWAPSESEGAMRDAESTLRGTEIVRYFEEVLRLISAVEKDFKQKKMRVPKRPKYVVGKGFVPVKGSTPLKFDRYQAYLSVRAEAFLRAKRLWEE